MTYPFDPYYAETPELSSAPDDNPFGFLLGAQLADLVWDNDLIDISWFEDLRVEGFTRNFDLIETLELRARLREMKLRMLVPLISLIRLKHSLIASILLLFGLCGTQSSYIFAAFFGTSSTRIFDL